MNFQRFSGAVLLAAALVAPGCKKKNADTGTGSAGASGSATVVITGSGGSAAATGSGSAAPAGSGAASTNPPPKIGTGDPAKSDALKALALPMPKGVTGATWKDVDSEAKDGNRLANLKNAKDDILMSVRFIDCRRDLLKDYVSKAPGDRGEFSYCFDAPTGQLKGFDLIAPPDSEQHAVRAGNIAVLAGSGANFVQDRVKPADLDAFLESIDLAAISKL